MCVTFSYHIWSNDNFQNVMCNIGIQLYLYASRNPYMESHHPLLISLWKSSIKTLFKLQLYKQRYELGRLSTCDLCLPLALLGANTDSKYYLSCRQFQLKYFWLLLLQTSWLYVCHADLIEIFWELFIIPTPCWPFFIVPGHW